MHFKGAGFGCSACSKSMLAIHPTVRRRFSSPLVFYLAEHWKVLHAFRPPDSPLSKNLLFAKIGGLASGRHATIWSAASARRPMPSRTPPLPLKTVLAGLVRRP